MALVKDWFPAFVIDHCKRLGVKIDAVPSTDEWQTLFQGWVAWLIEQRVSRPEAEAASLRMQQAVHPPRFWNEQLPRLKAAIAEVRKDAFAYGDGLPTDGIGPPLERDAAASLARDCDDCGGQTGLATRYRHASRQDGQPPTVQLYCLCPLGRWLERNHAQKAPEIRRRIPDLKDHPLLQGREYRDPPGLHFAAFARRYPTVKDFRAKLAGDLGAKFSRERPRSYPIPSEVAAEVAAPIRPPSPEEIAAIAQRINRPVPPRLAPVPAGMINPGDPDWPPF